MDFVSLRNNLIFRFMQLGILTAEWRSKLSSKPVVSAFLDIMILFPPSNGTETFSRLE